MKTYLITGGAGFIGSTLGEKILAQGDKVIILDNFNDYYDYLLKIKNVLDMSGREKESQNMTEYFKYGKEVILNKIENINTLKSIVNSENIIVESVDIRDLEEMGRVFSTHDVDTVIHLAAMAGVRPSIDDPLLYEDVNVRGTNILFEVMRRNGVKKILAASSSSVYGNNKTVPFKESDIVDFAISPYAATKKSNEVLAHTYYHLYDMSVVMLRFFTVFGPRQRPDLAISKFTKLISQGEKIPFYGDGTTSRDYTYVEDIADGVLLLSDYLDKNNKVYEICNIGGSDPVSLKEMVETIEKVLNKKAELEMLPMQPGDVERTYADLTKIKTMVGYAPKNTFSQGIEKFTKWYFQSK